MHANDADAGFPSALEESSQDELWLISYADLITLLVGFFVLLLAASPLKAARFERLAASLSGEAPPLENLKEKVDALATERQLSHRISTEEDAEGLAIELKDVLLFDSGSAQVRAEGEAVLVEMAQLLASLPGRPVSVEGHTDEVPIRTAEFRSNWELSAARAIRVRDVLEQAGVPRERMSVRGYADTRNLDKQPEPLDQLRAARRRVVIRVE